MAGTVRYKFSNGIFRFILLTSFSPFFTFFLTLTVTVILSLSLSLYLISLSLSLTRSLSLSVYLFLCLALSLFLVQRLIDIPAWQLFPLFTCFLPLLLSICLSSFLSVMFLPSTFSSYYFNLTLLFYLY